MCSKLVQEQQRKYMPCQVNLLRQRSYATWCSSGCKVPQLCTKSKRQNLNDHPSKEKPYDAKLNGHKLSSDQTPDYLIYYINIYIDVGGFDRSTQLLHFMWGIGFGSWLELELLLGGKILRKSPENPRKSRASLPEPWGKILPTKKKLRQDSSFYEILPQPGAKIPFQKSAVWWMIYVFLLRETLCVYYIYIY